MLSCRSQRARTWRARSKRIGHSGEDAGVLCGASTRPPADVARGSQARRRGVLGRAIRPIGEVRRLPSACEILAHFGAQNQFRATADPVLAKDRHANGDTTLNVYTQVLDDSLRAAVEKVGDELFTIVHQPEGAGSLSH
jgi:hypothetical protein